MNQKFDLPDNLYYGGGGSTFLTPLALVMLVVASVLILVLPRKHVIVPLLVGASFIPMSIQVLVGGLHIQSYRLILLAGCLRMVGDALSKHDFPISPMTPLDKVFISWALVSTLTFCILWGEWGAVVNRIGFLYTTLAAYAIARHAIRSKTDVIRAIHVLAVIVTIIAPLMLLEHVTGRNPFSLVGAPELAAIREGHIRAQGPFSHSIIAGTVGAVLMPLFGGLWWIRRDRLLAGLAVVSCTVMTFVSASSTPMMAYLAGILAISMWRARRRMRTVRWGIVCGLIALQMVMKAPVWFILSRLGALTGGTGWHRAYLIDNFVWHFTEWWLIGTQNNSQWGYFMFDSINSYVNAGVEGGLITFVLYIAVFVYAYKRIGAARKMAERSPRDGRLIWAIGACVFANTVALFGITYFDQSILLLYVTLAMAVVTTRFVAQPARTIANFQVAGVKTKVAEPELALGQHQTLTDMLRQM